jgi:hypothetical protein
MRAGERGSLPSLVVFGGVGRFGCVRPIDRVETGLAHGQACALRLDGDAEFNEDGVNRADPAGHPFCLARRPEWAEPTPVDG